MEPVTVLVPNYNKAPFIARTLESLRSQTYSDWRAVILDSYSDDGSWEIIKSFALADTRITAFQQPRPVLRGRNFYDCWNQLVSEVESEFCVFLTSDDIWPADWLRQMLGLLEQAPLAVAAISQTRFIDEGDKSLGVGPFNSLFEDSIGIGGNSTCVVSCAAASIAALLLGSVFSSVHSIILRSSQVCGHLSFADDLEFAADHEFYVQLSQLGKVVYTTAIAAPFRVYQDQASSHLDFKAKEQLFAKVVRRNIASSAIAAGVDPQALGMVAERILRRRGFLAGKPKLREWTNQPIKAATQFFPLVVRQPMDLMNYIGANMAGRRYVEDFAVRETQRFLKQNGISE